MGSLIVLLAARRKIAHCAQRRPRTRAARRDRHASAGVEVLAPAVRRVGGFDRVGFQDLEECDAQPSVGLIHDADCPH